MRKFIIKTKTLRGRKKSSLNFISHYRITDFAQPPPISRNKIPLCLIHPCTLNLIDMEQMMLTTSLSEF